MAEVVEQIDDGLPVVASRKLSNWGLYAFFIALLLGGFWIFSILSANRATVTAPSTMIVEPDPSTRIASPAPLDIPNRFQNTPPVRLQRIPTSFNQRSFPTLSVPPATVVENINPRPPRAQPSSIQNADTFPVTNSPEINSPEVTGPSVIFDNSFDRFSRPTPHTSTSSDTNSTQNSSARVSATRFANPSFTVPQGTVIQAVLETALDSTRPGAARALVQRDVYGFDGKRVLIQRGSRIYGEYEASLSRGQNRALIRWTRLLRPDGVTIALDSPSADPLGRAGVKGKVDGKFLQRFGNALLQSVFDIGIGIATRKASDGVVVALPGSTQNLQVAQQDQFQPTLKIRHGTSVSVFVARDLDFASVDR